MATRSSPFGVRLQGRPDHVKRILLDTSTDLGRDRCHQGHGMPSLMQTLPAV